MMMRMMKSSGCAGDGQLKKGQQSQCRQRLESGRIFWPIFFSIKLYGLCRRRRSSPSSRYYYDCDYDDANIKLIGSSLSIIVAVVVVAVRILFLH